MPLSPDNLKELPNPLFPPCLTPTNTLQKTELRIPKQNIDPTIRNNLESDFLLRKNISKEPNYGKSVSYECLKVKSKEKITKFKQKVYHELLKQKYGFIQPRLK